jgi:hypothetical protein
MLSSVAECEKLAFHIALQFVLFHAHWWTSSTTSVCSVSFLEHLGQRVVYHNSVANSCSSWRLGRCFKVLLSWVLVSKTCVCPLWLINRIFHTPLLTNKQELVLFGVWMTG